MEHKLKLRTEKSNPQLPNFRTLNLKFDFILNPEQKRNISSESNFGNRFRSLFEACH